MQNITFGDNEYNIVKDYRSGFDADALKEKYTDYFAPYDYVLGDWAYGKLRLKGFYKKGHKNCKDLNNYDNLQDYLKNSCAYDCRYFILEKK